MTDHHGITVFEREGKQDREYDVFSRLLKDRIVFITGPIFTKMADNIIAQLIFLEANDRGAPISMYINSPGGYCTAGLAIYDTMQYIKSPVHTMCLGMACSMASLLLAGGHPGKRSALPNAEVMIHQVSGGALGQETEIAIAARNIKKLRKRLDEILAHHTGLPVKKITRLTERDNYLTAEEAKELNIIDKVLRHSK